MIIKQIERITEPLGTFSIDQNRCMGTVKDSPFRVMMPVKRAALGRESNKMGYLTEKLSVLAMVSMPHVVKVR